MAADCGDCAEQEIVTLACDSQSTVFLIEVPGLEQRTDALAGQSGTVNVDAAGQRFSVQAEWGEPGLLGPYPSFEVLFDDPIIEALSSGQAAVFSAPGAGAVSVGLRGSRVAIEGARDACVATGNSIAFAGDDSDADPRSEPDRLVWRTTTGFDPRRRQPTGTMVLGVPETDAYLMAASCSPTSPRQPPAFTLDVNVEAGAAQPGEEVEVLFDFDGDRFSRDGTVFEESSEYAGVRITPERDDAVWDALGRAEGATFGVFGQRFRSVDPSAGPAPARRFLSDCDELAANVATGAPVVGRPAAPPASTPAPVAVNRSEYACDGGGSITVAYVEIEQGSIATIEQGADYEAALIAGPSGSGVRYSNGDYFLHTKGPVAMFWRGSELHRAQECRER